MIVDPRRLDRNCLVWALEAPECGFRSRALACSGDWHQNEEIRIDTGAILSGIGTTDAADPALADDIRLLGREFGHIPVIVMGDSVDPSHVLRILGHGARGYIPTSVSLSVAVQAISLTRSGGMFVPARCLMQANRNRRKDPEPAQR